MRKCPQSCVNILKQQADNNTMTATYLHLDLVAWILLFATEAKRN